MESRQYDQVAWQSCEDASLGLLELVCRPSESMITSLIASDRPDDPLAEPPSWEAAVRYYHVRTGRLPDCKDRLINLLSRDVAELDRYLSEQVDAVLHHPRFQSMEAAWRGLGLLVEGTGGQENLKVKVLHLPKAQLDADLHGAIEFDQSAFFRKVYEEEYGMAGGEPWGTHWKL